VLRRPSRWIVTELQQALSTLPSTRWRRVAERLGVSLTTVKRWAAGTVVPHALVVPHVISAVERTIQEGCQSSACCATPMVDSDGHVTRCVTCGWRSR
jgi:hypothetical protein